MEDNEKTHVAHGEFGPDDPLRGEEIPYYLPKDLQFKWPIWFRVNRALRRAGISTWSQVESMDDKHLGAIINIGPMSVCAIRDAQLRHQLAAAVKIGEETKVAIQPTETEDYEPMTVQGTREMAQAITEWVYVYGKRRARIQAATFREDDFLMGATAAFFALRMQNLIPAAWIFGPLTGRSVLTEEPPIPKEPELQDEEQADANT